VLPYIKTASDLVTSADAIGNGFLDQAVEKSVQATAYIQKAKDLLTFLKSKSTLHEVMQSRQFQKELLTAAGLSDKAQVHLSAENLESILSKLVKQDLLGDEWRLDLVFRYLLTKGDSLGGTMRNITGALGGKKFGDAVIAALKLKNIQPEIGYDRENSKVQSLSWGKRLMIFDKKCPLISKNVDIILLDSSSQQTPQELLKQPEYYIACGELKGGIDPAGSDEHWKTANSALQRIRDKFGSSLKVFFVGAVIVNHMAQEIFAQLKNGQLSHTANLTKPQQLEDLVNWLVKL
jgi:hypothetical protein